ncbi:alpha/beta hydrolase [uncultured Psychroserpens sp.]|uniref:alpha/beta hydrolase n=1 Tax=uncultured Psychroserpens sp. TaxID=255436 RepID=UPI00262D0DEA|nr:alpha/beta hydrolase [uncultured Psychroserpens sp.]
MTSNTLKTICQIAILLWFHLTISQQEQFTCKNESFNFLKSTKGQWFVTTKDRTLPGNYENNHGTAIITNSIEGCGIKESYRGTYRNKPYGREVVITGLDSTHVQMIALDSEHGSFSTLEGAIKNDTLTTYWYRNKTVKRLQSKYIMSVNSANRFEFSSYLSTDYGKQWALTHQRIYHKITHNEVTFTTTDNITVYGDLYTINQNRTTLILTHQGGSNAQGEYHTIIPKLLNEGYNVLAIDLRVGGSSYYGDYNRTVANLKKDAFNYCDAYPDIEGALNYLIKNNYTGPRILWGSSYSAALGIQLASKRPNDISAILAFSPSTGNAVKNCHPNPYLENISIPLLLLRPQSEMERQASINQLNIAKAHNHKTYIAKHGVHGSSLLVEERVKEDVSKTWEIILEFLSPYNR